MISIAGGIYAERCMYPAWNQIFGSGLRAAIAASSVSDDVNLHAYAPREWKEDVEATMASFGVTGLLRTSEDPITFEYLDAFRLTNGPVRPAPLYPELVVQDDVVLRFA